LHVAADEEDGGVMEMQDGDRKPSPSSMVAREGSELLTSATRSLAETWKPVGLQENIIAKGNGERFLTYTFAACAGADAKNSFVAILENQGEVLNLRQRVPDLALDHVRFHKKLKNYDEDNIEISVATAQVTAMRAGISSTNAIPEIWSDYRINLPFAVQESFVQEEGSGDVYGAKDKAPASALVFKVKMKSQVSVTSRAGAIGAIVDLD
jgi:hypothetical protein